MSREFILGTAGHIDHGKTALIKALTGIDCDRLPEEKTRGITIDIGFAELNLDEFRLGVVDVPGHERFIKNMLAGATGIDLALLVVAADDSVMPQTREHVEILKLLGIRRGVIALTKCDLVDRESREVSMMEARDLVAGSFLADAAIVCTSVMTGEGLDRLRDELRQVCVSLVSDSQPLTANSDFPFRLAIDRAFILQGHGTVVTGTVASGQIRVGDELEWLPRQERVRVRGLHHHGRMVDEIHRGMRAAINLAGVEHTEVQRGQELATPGYLIPSRTLTARVSVSPDLDGTLKHRLPVRVHIGTAEVMGVLSRLDTESLALGDSGLAQLFLEEPVMAVWNQAFVLRESSAATTLGGGRVLQPVARKIRRQDTAVIGRLLMFRSDRMIDRAQAMAQAHGAAGFTKADLSREAGIPLGETTAIIAQMIQAHHVVEVSAHGHSRLMHVEVVREIEERIAKALGRLHEAEPLVSGQDRAKVQAQLDYLGDDGIVSAVVDRMLAEKKLIADGRRIARVDFRPKLTANQRKLKDKIVAAHAVAGFQPPDPASFAAQAGGQAANLHDIYDVAVAEGELVKVSDDIYLDAAAEADMRRRVQAALLQSSEGLTVAAIRNLLGTTRKYAVPYCEYLDRIGVTRRIGDFRVATQEVAAATE